jgi:hypothetical protein
MHRRDRKLLRQAMGQQDVHIPLTVAFWTAWLLFVLDSLHYLGVF